MNPIFDQDLFHYEAIEGMSEAMDSSNLADFPVLETVEMDHEMMAPPEGFNLLQAFVEGSHEAPQQAFVEGSHEAPQQASDPPYQSPAVSSGTDHNDTDGTPPSSVEGIGPPMELPVPAAVNDEMLMEEEEEFDRRFQAYMDGTEEVVQQASLPSVQSPAVSSGTDNNGTDGTPPSSVEATGPPMEMPVPEAYPTGTWEFLEALGEFNGSHDRNQAFYDYLVPDTKEKLAIKSKLVVEGYLKPIDISGKIKRQSMRAIADFWQRNGYGPTVRLLEDVKSSTFERLVKGGVNGETETVNVVDITCSVGWRKKDGSSASRVDYERLSLCYVGVLGRGKVEKLTWWMGDLPTGHYMSLRPMDWQHEA